MDRDTEFFFEDYLENLRSETAAIFAGAGLSKAAGYVDWAGLLAPVAKGLGLNSAMEPDLVSLAQFHLNANHDNRHTLNQLLIDKFSDLRGPTENHRLLARLPIQTFWTTNYDRLIETALTESGKRVDTKYAVEQLSTTRRGRDAIIYKMHGDVENPTKAILSRNDYEKYHLTHQPFINALSGDLVNKTFLFLGFGFTDPNLNYVLSHVRNAFAGDQRKHFCIVRRRTKNAGEDQARADYAIIRQKLVAEDLLRFNISTLFVNDFADITEYLQILERRVRRRTVFVSGSAADFGPWGQEKTEGFLSSLAAALVDRDLKIATGFGLGVGGAIVAGAVRQIYSTSQKTVAEQLILRPFPFGIKDSVERTQTHARYREELIGQAGIAVFFMGNRVDNGTTMPAPGVRTEYELARSQGLYLIPIGTSGGTAAELWKACVQDIANIFPGLDGKVAPLLNQLNEPTDDPMTLLAPTLALIDALSDR